MDLDWLKKKCKVCKRKGRVTVSLPLIMDISENACNLVLTILLHDDGAYTIYCTDDMFYDSGYYPQKSFDAYVADKNNKTYGIRYEDKKFIADFTAQDNPIFPTSYFIKFFIDFNNFIIKNF